MTKNISMTGTATITAGSLDNRNIGSIVSFSHDDEWVSFELGMISMTKDDVAIFPANVRADEYVVDDDTPVYVTQPLAERYLYAIRNDLRSLQPGQTNVAGGARADQIAALRSVAGRA